jgi:hypothetical protein
MAVTGFFDNMKSSAELMAEATTGILNSARGTFKDVLKGKDVDFKQAFQGMFHKFQDAMVDDLFNNIAKSSGIKEMFGVKEGKEDGSTSGLFDKILGIEGNDSTTKAPLGTDADPTSVKIVNGKGEKKKKGKGIKTPKELKGIAEKGWKALFPSDKKANSPVLSPELEEAYAFDDTGKSAEEISAANANIDRLEAIREKSLLDSKTVNGELITGIEGANTDFLGRWFLRRIIIRLWWWVRLTRWWLC